MAFNLFPYSNFHKLNLDWVIKQIKDAMAALEAASQTVTSYESRLATVESRLATVESSVQALTTATGNLQTAVNSHTSQIQTNTSQIQTNTSQIQTNTSQIQTNTSQIQTNTSQIQTNTSQIQTNTTAISQLNTEVQEAMEKAEHPAFPEEGTTAHVIPSLSTETDNVKVLYLNGHNPDGLPHIFTPIIRNVGTPQLEGDAANKEYVDANSFSKATYSSNNQWTQAFPNNQLADLPVNSIVIINSSQIIPADLPGTMSGTGSYYMIVTLGTSAQLTARDVQIIIRQTGQIFTRMYTGSSWAAWYKFSGTSDPTPT